MKETCPFFFSDVNGKNICKYLILVSIGDTKGVYIYSVLGTQYSVNIYLLRVNKRNTRKIYEICSKLTIILF